MPFEISQERFAFAERCRPFYEKWYPEVLEEIKGIADGQKTDSRKLEAVLLSMYCIMPEVKCSCFAFKSGEHIILARNSDFLPEIEKRNMNCIYMLDGRANHFQGNTTAFVEMEDGINEYGLAVGLTSVYPNRVYGIDNWNAEERYETIRTAFCRDGEKAAVSLAAEILSGKYGFICQYDRKTGKDTVWSVIYDVGIKKIYRCEENPSRKRYTEDNRFTLE